MDWEMVDVLTAPLRTVEGDGPYTVGDFGAVQGKVQGFTPHRCKFIGCALTYGNMLLSFIRGDDMNQEAHSELGFLGENLVYLRKANGISKREMARIMVIGVQTLTKLERGELPPRMKVEALFRVQNRFGVPVHRLLGERLSKGE